MKIKDTKSTLVFNMCDDHILANFDQDITNAIGAKFEDENDENDGKDE